MGGGGSRERGKREDKTERLKIIMINIRPLPSPPA